MDIAENYVCTFFITNSFVRYGSREGKNSRHYMLAFPLFMAVPSEDYHISLKDK